VLLDSAFREVRRSSRTRRSLYLALVEKGKEEPTRPVTAGWRRPLRSRRDGRGRSIGDLHPPSPRRYVGGGPRWAPPPAPRSGGPCASLGRSRDSVVFERRDRLCPGPWATAWWWPPAIGARSTQGARRPLLEHALRILRRADHDPRPGPRQGGLPRLFESAGSMPSMPPGAKGSFVSKVKDSRRSRTGAG
jgi:hypothetical protein